MCVNRLSLNCEKTDCLLIGSRNMLTKNKSLNVQVRGNPIEHTKYVKDLTIYRISTAEMGPTY